MRDDSVPAFLSSEAWDRRADRILDSSDYDTSLGKRMARDAIRVTMGELSEAEFHEKYHEEVLEEFGVDDRPTAPGNDE
ncbi:MAG: 4Fe-4S ferredoxin N-terminal domain-containing protein [Halodesulfurarchaeum sp.]